MLIPEDQIWIVVVGFIVAFVLAFGIGANDVANSFGTSVGSKVLTLRQACLLATVCELSGSILLGAEVSSTIRSGITEMSYFMEHPQGVKLLLYGQIAALVGSCIWLLVATFFRVPVSGTHSIVGATMGFALVAFNHKGVKWMGLLKIVGSWFISPLLSGLVSVVLFFLLRKFVLQKEEPLEPALSTLPAIYGVSIFINVISIFINGPPLLKLKLVPLWGAFIVSICLGLIVAILVKFVLCPRLRLRVLRELHPNPGHLDQKEKNDCFHRFLKRLSRKQKPSSSVTPLAGTPTADKNITVKYDKTLEQLTLNPLPRTASSPDSDVKKVASTSSSGSQADDNVKNSRKSIQTIISLPEAQQQLNSASERSQTEGLTEMSEHPDERSNEVQLVIPPVIKDRPEEARVFSYVQILTAIFGSFAHGGNDVSNAIGPLIGLWIIATTQDINSQAETPLYILLYGGLGIVAGLWAWGRRVIETLGEDLTTITPTSGVCIELGSAVTVLVASNIGLPISTTHCKVGSVVCVGRFRSKDNVNWALMRNIVIAWVVTLPASGGISALTMYGLMQLLKL